ncbi:alpha/beta hydrolase [Janibacter alkaliphilus]|uniref:Alpha/beta hydrolase family protein n=1 Tax=Janibacter alkaliphilus TaxID=1069963 RepID=A0A852X1Y2_9MICO|nr:alpha/beta hydrolase [Janibacter alkaliphilus]NYG37322.1 hypothetical protein [Janibacter alkaliphilus]
MSTEIVLVPGLRGSAPDHWQERMAATTGATHLPVGRDPLDLDGRVGDLDAVVSSASGPVLLVAHSAGVLTLLHWAARASAEQGRRVVAGLLVTPPTLRAELPPVYPRLSQMREAGWLPVPSGRLPFASTVLVSEDDALVPAGHVGHANPASGFGAWPFVEEVVEDLLGVSRPRV